MLKRRRMLGTVIIASWLYHFITVQENLVQHISNHESIITAYAMDGLDRQTKLVIEQNISILFNGRLPLAVV